MITNLQGPVSLRILVLFISVRVMARSDLKGSVPTRTPFLLTHETPRRPFAAYLERRLRFYPNHDGNPI